MLNGPTNRVEKIIFESINGKIIKDIICKMSGSGGPSGCEVDQWKQILMSKNFAHNGDDLANSIAKMA